MEPRVSSSQEQTEKTLSIKRCRELLPDSQHLSDDDVRALRDQLYMLAGIIVDLLPDKCSGFKNGQRKGGKR
jgi:hypothetical protein